MIRPSLDNLSDLSSDNSFLKASIISTNSLPFLSISNGTLSLSSSNLPVNSSTFCVKPTNRSSILALLSSKILSKRSSISRIRSSHSARNECVAWMRRCDSTARARSAAVSWTRSWARECSWFCFRWAERWRMRVSKEPSPRGREASFFLAGERKGAVEGAVSELWLVSLIGGCRSLVVAVVWGEGWVGGGAGGAVAADVGAAVAVAVAVAVAAS
mmetsp:Transcript_9450/g.17625  ORF Transcript_9450/g.17625 Transcript_9450/m.17625 type:complete len:215 (+) Transcript_9450:647-1291(+)